MGYGWMAVLFWILELLAIAALLKYLYFGSRRK